MSGWIDYNLLHDNDNNSNVLAKYSKFFIVLILFFPKNNSLN